MVILGETLQRCNQEEFRISHLLPLPEITSVDFPGFYLSIPLLVPMHQHISPVCGARQEQSEHITMKFAFLDKYFKGIPPGLLLSNHMIFQYGCTIIIKPFLYCFCFQFLTTLNNIQVYTYPYMQVLLFFSRRGVSTKRYVTRQVKRFVSCQF